MSLIVRDLPTLTPSSSGSLFSRAIGQLDDATSISLFLASSANANTSAATIQVAPFDPTLPWFAGPGTQQAGLSSSFWVTLSTAIATITSSASQLVINNVAFRGLRLSITTSNAGEVIAYVSKQITV